MCLPSGTRTFVRWEQTLIPYHPCTQPRHWYQTPTRSPRAATAGKQWRVGFWGPVPGSGEFDRRQDHMWIKAPSIDSGKTMDNGQWQPTPVFLPGKSHRWRSLTRHSPWGRKESDSTEWLHRTSIVSGWRYNLETLMQQMKQQQDIHFCCAKPPRRGDWFCV